jgi:phosphoribosyl 1,2-cyclic phosphodiesterase
MAKIKTISSGSNGNAYILESEGEVLLIELGVSWKEIVKGLNYDLNNINACLVSHTHLDHSKSIPDAIKSGISVYSCEEVQSIHKEVKVLKKGLKTPIGGFKVQRVDLFHNCECIGFLITTPDKQKILFCTDTHCIPYKFKNVNHFLVEANNSFDLMLDKMCDNDYGASASESHMEINSTIEFLKENYSADCMTIMLLHLSRNNADEKLFKKMVQDELGFKNVFVAKKGLEIELNACEF